MMPSVGWYVRSSSVAGNERQPAGASRHTRGERKEPVPAKKAKAKGQRSVTRRSGGSRWRSVDRRGSSRGRISPLDGAASGAQRHFQAS